MYFSAQKTNATNTIRLKRQARMQHSAVQQNQKTSVYTQALAYVQTNKSHVICHKVLALVLNQMSGWGLAIPANCTSPYVILRPTLCLLISLLLGIIQPLLSPMPQRCALYRQYEKPRHCIEQHSALFNVHNVG